MEGRFPFQIIPIVTSLVFDFTISMRQCFGIYDHISIEGGSGHDTYTMYVNILRPHGFFLDDKLTYVPRLLTKLIETYSIEIYIYIYR